MNRRTLTITYSEHKASELSPQDADLITAAFAATQLSYAPYSKFYVGAAARLSDQTIVKAANLENAAFPQCLCAEACLLGTLHTQHGGKIIEAVAVAIRTQHAMVGVAAPCGSCRQQLFEAEARQSKPIQLLLSTPDRGAQIFASVRDLLPFGFDGSWN